LGVVEQRKHRQESGYAQTSCLSYGCRGVGIWIS